MLNCYCVRLGPPDVLWAGAAVQMVLCIFVDEKVYKELCQSLLPASLADLGVVFDLAMLLPPLRRTEGCRVAVLFS